MEQMISANPDVTTCDLTPDLEFIVMACDGIWNSMSSQQAIDFVKSRLSEDIELSNICEQVRIYYFLRANQFFIRRVYETEVIFCYPLSPLYMFTSINNRCRIIFLINVYIILS